MALTDDPRLRDSLLALTLRTGASRAAWQQPSTIAAGVHRMVGSDFPARGLAALVLWEHLADSRLVGWAPGPSSDDALTVWSPPPSEGAAVARLHLQPLPMLDQEAPWAMAGDIEDAVRAVVADLLSEADFPSRPVVAIAVALASARLRVGVDASSSSDSCRMVRAPAGRVVLAASGGCHQQSG